MAARTWRRWCPAPAAASGRGRRAATSSSHRVDRRRAAVRRGRRSSRRSSGGSAGRGRRPTARSRRPGPSACRQSSTVSSSSARRCSRRSSADTPRYGRLAATRDLPILTTVVVRLGSWLTARQGVRRHDDHPARPHGPARTCPVTAGCRWSATRWDSSAGATATSRARYDKYGPGVVDQGVRQDLGRGRRARRLRRGAAGPRPRLRERPAAGASSSARSSAAA